LAGPTGYEPLNTLKPVAEGVWLIDGPAIKFMGLPFSTRATVVRLENGDLWVHSPTQLTDSLREELAAVGPVAHLIAPNWIHFAHIAEWQAAFPKAAFWAAPGVVARAEKKGLTLPKPRDLQADKAERPWAGQLRQMIVQGSKVHREAVFFHKASKTLILTDLIEAFETDKLPVWMRPIVWIAGIDDSDGKMPPDMRWSFRDKAALARDLETMIGWSPERVILAHGRWYERNGVGELERAFRRVLKDHRWDKLVKHAKEKHAEHSDK